MRLGTQAFHVREGLRVATPTSTLGDRQIVAGVLALEPDLPGDPEHGRVVEKDRLEQGLQ